jgi:hypothetical protein
VPLISPIISSELEDSKTWLLTSVLQKDLSLKEDKTPSLAAPELSEKNAHPPFPTITSTGVSKMTIGEPIKSRLQEDTHDKLPVSFKDLKPHRPTDLSNQTQDHFSVAAASSSISESTKDLKPIPFTFKDETR